MKLFCAVLALFGVMGMAWANPPGKDTGKISAEAKQSRQDLMARLREKLGSGYKVLESEDGEDIEIHSITPVYYTVAVINGNGSPPKEHDETDVVNIHPTPEIDLAAYQKFTAEAKERNKAFQAWKKKLAGIRKSDRGDFPDTEVMDLLKSLQPETDEQVWLARDYAKFVEACEEAEKAAPPLPSHQFGGALYYVFSLTDWTSCVLEGDGKSIVQVADRAVAAVMKRLE